MNPPGQNTPEEEPREPVGSSEPADATERRTSPERPPNASGDETFLQRATRRTERFAHETAEWARPAAQRTGDRIVRWVRRFLALLAALTERAVQWLSPRMRRAHERLVPLVERVRDRIAPAVERVAAWCAPAVREVRRRLAPVLERVRTRIEPHLSRLRAKLPDTGGRHRVAPRARSVQLTAAAAAVGVLAIIVGTAGQGTGGQTTTPAAHTVDIPSQERTQADDPGVLSAPAPGKDDGSDKSSGKSKSSEGGEKQSRSGSRISPEAAAAIGPNASGIDVSNHNGSIDWNRVAASGQKYAFVLATDGGNFTNPMFQQQFQGAKDAGMLAGAYHFGRPNGSAVAQADRLMDNMGSVNDGRTLPPVLDLEVSPSTGGCYGKTTGQMHAWTQAFLDRVQSRTGQQGIIYASPSFWSNCMAGSQAFSEYPLWLASYGVSQPSVPGGWSNYSFWQYTNKGTVPGISGPVDINRFQGSGKDLLQLTK
ncbi:MULTISPECIES: GH25 family lysozyme [unclassified Actinopolyspora]|uniref:GH25 family lysozyme n=1 Tax=unclassified Actinopolyspora TaxID=2639451 RepID=UPI0013F68CC1|nr:hypothetical protein [Actinopolyspora sp. BKK2]NHE76087.1 hypothetical protein [Actinopolyspora sp. BKK1]